MGLVVFWIEPLGVLGVIEKLTPNVTYRVRTHLPVVALSFDDGPHPRFTLQVLEILRQHDATATFFLIGERAIRHPDVVSKIKADGHEVGNHYFKNGPTFRAPDIVPRKPVRFLGPGRLPPRNGSRVEFPETACGFGSGPGKELRELAIDEAN
jgi:hypothetical protein